MVRVQNLPYLHSWLIVTLFLTLKLVLGFIVNCWTYLSPQLSFKFVENKWFLFHLCTSQIALIIKGSPNK